MELYVMIAAYTLLLAACFWLGEYLQEKRRRKNRPEAPSEPLPQTDDPTDGEDLATGEKPVV